MRLNTYSRPTSITVNGVVVNWAGPGATVEDMFSPGPLTPNTAYLVTTTATGPEGPVTLELRFTTGTGMATAVETPVLSNLRLDPYEAPSVPHTCPAVLEAQDCFDTGQDAVVRADATGTPTLWVLWRYPAGDAGPVAPQLLASWPGECGAPSYVTHRDRFETDPSCLRVTAVGANGETSQSNFLCPEELRSDGVVEGLLGRPHEPRAGRGVLLGRPGPRRTRRATPPSRGSGRSTPQGLTPPDSLRSHGPASSVSECIIEGGLQPWEVCWLCRSWVVRPRKVRRMRRPAAMP